MTTTFPSPASEVEARSSWRDERRQDKLNDAELKERRADAQLQRQLAAQEAGLKLKAQEREQRRIDKAKARKSRGERLAGAGDWFKTHVRGLALVAVIGVPGVLAADGQADWGMQQWGPLGLILPAFSEGTAWYFALSAEHARKENPDAPVWHLRLGTWVFAAIGAALNFVHGVAQGGMASGITMGVTSAAGITSHQIVKAGPRRSRQQRRDARLARKRARLESRVMNTALESGTVVLSPDGQSRLTVRSGAVRLRRSCLGTRRLEPARTVEEEVADIGRAALALADRAEAEASRVLGQSERCAELVRVTRQQAAQQTADAEASKAKAADEMARAEELTAQARTAAEEAAAREAAADQRADDIAARARAELDQAHSKARQRIDQAEAARAAADAAAAEVRTAYQSAAAALEHAGRQLEQLRHREATAVTRAENAEAARTAAIAEADQVRSAYRSAAESLDEARREAEQSRAAEAAAVARAEAAEAQIRQAATRQARRGETKKAHLLRLYREHDSYGEPDKASKTATELAAIVGCSAGSARRDVREHLRGAGILPAPAETTAEAPIENPGEQQDAGQADGQDNEEAA